MAIMVVALGAILTSQSSAIIQATRTKELNIAGWLAQKKMVETEEEYTGKRFIELSESESGQFEEPYQHFTWQRDVREPKFPDIAQLAQKEGDPSTDLMRTFAQSISKYLNDSIRELVITVKWRRASSEEKVTISTYLVDLNTDFNFSP